MLRKSIEFLIAASPTPGFYGQIAMFRKSVHEFYPDARVDVCYGPVPDGTSYPAQSMERYQRINPSADVSILCDADTMMVRPIDDVLQDLIRRPALAGVPCFGQPPYPVNWPGPCPFYVNHGFVGAPPPILARLYEASLEAIDALSDYPDQFWVPQIAISFAAHSHRLPLLPMPLRFNFPNDGVADAKYPYELADIRIIHYMNCGEYDRGRIFCEPQAFAEFMDKPLTGSSLVLQERVRHLTGGVFEGIAPK